MRRVAAIVLPELACELARRDHGATGPFAVIVDEDGCDLDEVVDKTATLHAVDRKAWQYGARPGQTASQAAAYVGQLRIVRLGKAQVLETLGALAEMLLDLGTTAALDLRIARDRLPQRDESKAASLRYPLGAGAGPRDTVWLDVSGCAKLVGGEDVLCTELEERARRIGHRARVVIADGPRIAQSLARWSKRCPLVAPAGRCTALLEALPVAALPLTPDLITWLGKLGVLRVEDLTKLDRARLSHRLGPAARDLLELIAGRDDTPLVMHRPPRRIVETTTFEHEIESTEPLLFVLRRLAARALHRLTLRGEACKRATMRLGFDRSVIALENRTRAEALAHERDLALELPVPLSREDELMRALSARLERAELEAPVVALTLVLDDLTEQSRHQLELGGRTGVDPSTLPTLLAELDAQLGKNRVGLLRLIDDHRPEARTQLVPVDDAVLAGKRAPSPAPRPDGELPTRIVPKPVPIANTDRGALIVVDKQPFVIERIRHTERLDHLHWWSNAPVHRDYARAWLRTEGDSGRETSEAWLFIDRTTGKAYLHGWFE
jgi:protein ImuB